MLHAPIVNEEGEQHDPIRPRMLSLGAAAQSPILAIGAVGGTSLRWRNSQYDSRLSRKCSCS